MDAEILKSIEDEIEKKIANQVIICSGKNELVLQGQAALVSSVKELTSEVKKMNSGIYGNGALGLKGETMLNTEHRKKMEGFLNNATSKIIGMILVAVLGSGGLVAAIMAMAK